MLCHPSSVDSLTTSAGTEDHVSMGGWAARKALRVVEHVEQGNQSSNVLILVIHFILHTNYSIISGYLFNTVNTLSFIVIAIELLAACQAIEFLRPLKSTAPLEAIYDVVRKVIPYVYSPALK